MMADFKGLLDMINGGGAGRAGQTFEGGPLSGMLNGLGIRPMGYAYRLADARPMQRPAGLGAQPATMQPQMAAQPQGVGQMSDEDLIKLIEVALRAAPPAIGFGPR